MAHVKHIKWDGDPVVAVAAITSYDKALLKLIQRQMPSGHANSPVQNTMIKDANKLLARLLGAKL